MRKEVQSTESWLYDSIAKQDELPLCANPLLTAETIAAKRTALFNVTNPIMIKPKPKPEPTPAPAPEKKAEPSPDSSTPMDQDKPAAAEEEKPAPENKN